MTDEFQLFKAISTRKKKKKLFIVIIRIIHFKPVNKNV